jgi:hypothetical protein
MSALYEVAKCASDGPTDTLQELTSVMKSSVRFTVPSVRIDLLTIK